MHVSAGSIRVAPASEPPSASAALPASIETLRRLAEAHGFTLQPKEETTYLELVDAALEDVRVVQQLPDYIDPRISTYAPAISKDPPREYARPDPKDNPLKAWSHKVGDINGSPSLIFLQDQPNSYSWTNQRLRLNLAVPHPKAYYMEKLSL